MRAALFSHGAPKAKRRGVVAVLVGGEPFGVAVERPIQKDPGGCERKGKANEHSPDREFHVAKPPQITRGRHYAIAILRSISRKVWQQDSTKEMPVSGCVQKVLAVASLRFVGSSAADLRPTGTFSKLERWFPRQALAFLRSDFFEPLGFRGTNGRDQQPREPARRTACPYCPARSRWRSRGSRDGVDHDGATARRSEAAL